MPYENRGYVNNPVISGGDPQVSVVVTVSEAPRNGVLVPEGELAALRAENARLDAANVGLAQESHNLQSELAEQCRLLAMGAEREARLMAEVAELKAQLPEGMKDCTIVFKECSKGHAWLTATNWVQHDCPICRAEEAERKLAEAATEVDVLRRFGNKDCTNMADEELDAIRTLMKEGGE
jgi:exosome complex RNA-binding protein Csl4